MDRAFVPSLDVMARKLGRLVTEEDLPSQAICREAADDLLKKDQRVFPYLETLAQVKKVAAAIVAGEAFPCNADGHFHPVHATQGVVPERKEARRLLALGEHDNLMPIYLSRLIICVGAAQALHRRGVITPHYEKAYEVLLEEEKERERYRRQMEERRAIEAARAEKKRQEEEATECARMRAASNSIPKTKRGERKKGNPYDGVDTDFDEGQNGRRSHKGYQAEARR
jgi:hypothetical protein